MERRESCPAISKNDINAEINDIKKSASSDDLNELKKKRDELQKKLYQTIEKNNEIDFQISDLDPDSEKNKEKVKNLQNLKAKKLTELTIYNDKLENVNKEITNKSDCIDDIYDYFINKKTFLSNEIKVKYLRKITKLEIKNDKEVEYKNYAIEKLKELEKTIFDEEIINNKDRADELKFLNLCIDGESTEESNIYDFKFNLENLVKQLEENQNKKEEILSILVKGFKLAHNCENPEMIKIFLENDKIKYLFFEDKKYLISFFSDICRKNYVDILSIILNDEKILNNIIVYDEKDSEKKIAVIINQTCSNNNAEILKMLFSNETFLKKIVFNEKNTMLILIRDLTCYKSGFLETTEAYIENDKIRKKMIENHYIIPHLRSAIEGGNLNIVKLMLGYNDVKEFVKKYNNLLLNFKEAILKNNFNKIKELLNNYELIKEIKKFTLPDNIRNNINELLELEDNKNLDSNKKINLKNQKIDNITQILKNNEEKEKEYIIDKIGNDLFSKIFIEAVMQEDSELIDMLLNDEKLDEYFEEIFAMSNLEVIESLIKNNFKFRKKTVVDFTHIKNKDADFTYIKNKDDFNKIKANFKAICKKYAIEYDENSLFIEDDTIFLKKYIIDLEKINEKITELNTEIKKRDEILKTAKTLIEECKPTEEEKENSISEKIANINNEIKKIKNLNNTCKKKVNIIEDKQLRNLCLPAIKYSNNEIFSKEGFGGNNIFYKKNVRIQFNKDGFLRQVAENNPNINRSILNILKNSLIIEHGNSWNDSYKIELDTVLMLFKKDPATAFKMLVNLESNSIITIKKKNRFLLAKKLNKNEKDGLQSAFKEVVKVRQEISNIIDYKKTILDSEFINEETKNVVEKITNLGIKIIKYNKKNIVGNKKSNVNENNDIGQKNINIKQEIIDNITKTLSSIKENEEIIKENEDKFKIIVEAINNSIKYIDNNNISNESMIAILNNCIINIDNFNKEFNKNQQVI